jgi:hypothetical protein
VDVDDWDGGWRLYDPEAAPFLSLRIAEVCGKAALRVPRNATGGKPFQIVWVEQKQNGGRRFEPRILVDLREPRERNMIRAVLGKCVVAFVENETKVVDGLFEFGSEKGHGAVWES